jgi:tetratricopeptide (TPR) repeat protein
VEANNQEQIEAAALNALAIAAEAAENNPSPALLLKQEAHECEARGDWGGAEACYRKVLPVEEATGNAGLVCKAHYDLSRFFLLLGDLEKAGACARAATAAARKADVFPLLVMTLEQESICALRSSDTAGALQAAEGAVQAVNPGRLHDGMRAGALVARARCRVAAGDLIGAQNDLATSRPLLFDRVVSPLFAGSNSRMAHWWQATAGVRALQGDLDGACEACAEAVKMLRHVASLPHVAGPYTLAALVRALKHLGEAFDAAGQPDEGQAAKAEAGRIWSELSLPG